MLVYDLKVADETTVGFYSGAIETSASIGVALGVFVWAALSDRYGRRRCIITGTTLACLLSAGFGFARSFRSLIAMRFLLGLALAAQGAIGKVMVAEMTDASNAAAGFALMSVIWQAGSTIAPSVGGFLARPAATWPGLFAGGIFNTYPYALPSIAAGILPAVGVVLSLPVLKETHPRLKYNLPTQNADAPKLDNLVADGSGYHTFPGQPSPKKAVVTRAREAYADLYAAVNKAGLPGLFTSGLDFLLLLWFLLLVQFLSIYITEILLFFSPPSIGGLGMDQHSMAAFLTLRPILVATYELCVFPSLSRRFGNERLFRWLMCLPLCISMVYLLTAHLSIKGLLDFNTQPGPVCILLGVSLALQILRNGVFIAGDCLLAARVPHSSQLSRSTALQEVVGQLGVSVGTSVSSSAFAFSAGLPEASLWKGRLVWVYVCVLTGAIALVSQRLTRRAGWREREQEQDEDEDATAESRNT